MERGQMRYYQVLLRPKQGAIHTHTVEADSSYMAMQAALACFPKATIIKITQVSG